VAEQLNTLFLIEIKCLFEILNSAIRKLNPEPKQLFFKRAQCINPQKEYNIAKLMYTYSNLSQSMNMLEETMGVFWLLVISQHCSFLVFMLGNSLIGPKNLKQKMQMGLLVINTLVRLVYFCFLFGSTTSEVNLMIYIPYSCFA
jgi:hypothetical protein